MQVEISGAGVSKAVETYIRKKAAKLDKYFSKAEMARVELHKYQSRKDGKNFRVEITVDVARKFVRAEEYGISFEEAADLTIGKVEKQLRRYKTKLIDKYRQPLDEETHVASKDAAKEDLPVKRVARVKHFKIKPMGVEEAVMQMDLSGHDFYIFAHQIKNEV